MPTYKAPLDDMRFVLNEVLGVSSLSKLKGFESVDDATVNQFLSEIGKMAEDVLFPLNMVGDQKGCVHNRDDKSVTTPPGFKEAYQQFCQAGLPGFACDPAYGGLGMPVVLNTALSEMFCSANMAFGMYPGLSHGAYNAIHEYGTEQQKQTYLPKIVTGEWTGTMCLTEPQCGTDLGLIKSKAAEQSDGSYKITGTKIFISAGEHDLADNIIHLVLAKIDAPDTPEGIKGISLFIVPKMMPDTGARNPIYCNRLEEKMGIHGNSTCEMGLEGATGWLIGEKHKGMRAMFVMMNEARLGVGLQGLGISEVSYQNALAYALDRKQSQPIDAKDPGAPVASIIEHADVRRELLTIKSQTEGARMLAYWVAMQLDIAQKSGDDAKGKAAKKLVDLLTPVVKAHLTDNASDHVNAAMQVFGGHGYIREHGVEQYARDARITRIYEGTNGIQALDLIGRKVLKENLLPGYLSLLRRETLASKAPFGMKACLYMSSLCLGWRLRRLQLRAVLAKMGLCGGMGGLLRQASAISTDFLKSLSLIALGHMWVRMAGVAQERLDEKAPNTDFYETKRQTAAFYFKKVFPQLRYHRAAMCSGEGPVNALPADRFAHLQTTVGESSRPAA